MSRVIAKDATDQSVTLVILTTSGTPKTDVVHNTADLSLWYRREGGAKVPITPVALATPTVDDPHLDGGFIHIGDGVYRLDLPDAAVASGADHVTIGGSVPDGVILSVEVQLVTIDLQAANLPANVTQWKGAAPADLTDTDKVQVSVQHMLDGVIAAAKIANNAITADKIASNAITAAKLASNAITSDKIAANAIGADQLANTAVAKIEAALIDDDDGQALLNAIVQAIDAANIDSDLLPGLIRDAILNRVLAGNHDTAGSVGKILQDILTDTGTTLDGKLDVIDGVVDAIKVVTDKLDKTVESDGDGGYQFTETALENAPAGGGGGGLTPEQATQLSETHDRVTTALPDAAPSSEEGLPVTGDLITQDDLASLEEVAAAVDSSLQVSFADVIAWSAAGLTMVQESATVPGAYQYTSDALSEIDVGDVVVDLSGVEAQLDTLLARVPSVLTPSTLNITSANPVASGVTLTIYKGNDYSSSAGNVPSWVQSGWPEATWDGATGVFRYRQRGSVATAGTVSLAQDGDTITATLTLTNEETSGMTSDTSGTYEVEITSRDGLKRTLATGPLVVVDGVANQ